MKIQDIFQWSKVSILLTGSKYKIRKGSNPRNKLHKKIKHELQQAAIDVLKHNGIML